MPRGLSVGTAVALHSTLRCRRYVGVLRTDTVRVRIAVRDPVPEYQVPRVRTVRVNGLALAVADRQRERWRTCGLVHRDGFVEGHPDRDGRADQVRVPAIRGAGFDRHRHRYGRCAVMDGVRALARPGTDREHERRREKSGIPCPEESRTSERRTVGRTLGNSGKTHPGEDSECAGTFAGSRPENRRIDRCRGDSFQFAWRSERGFRTPPGSDRNTQAVRTSTHPVRGPCRTVLQFK